MKAKKENFTMALRIILYFYANFCSTQKHQAYYGIFYSSRLLASQPVRQTRTYQPAEKIINIFILVHFNFALFISFENEGTGKFLIQEIWLAREVM